MLISINRLRQQRGARSERVPLGRPLISPYWLIAPILVLDAIGITIKGIKVELPTLVEPILIWLALLAASRLRRWPVAAWFNRSAAALALAIAATMALACLLAMNQRPPIDGALAAADRWLGFDWSASAQWLSVHPFENFWLILAYQSYPMQILVLLYLGARMRDHRGSELIWLNGIGLIVCLAVSGSIPSFGYPSAANLMGIHNLQTLRDPAIGTLSLLQSVGTISFPSFHAVLACTLTYCWRGSRAFVPMAALNAVMLISIPAIGGHYLADLAAGSAIGLLAIGITRWRIPTCSSYREVGENSPRALVSGLESE
jgi:PAP2 superfamily